MMNLIGFGVSAIIGVIGKGLRLRTTLLVADYMLYGGENDADLLIIMHWSRYMLLPCSVAIIGHMYAVYRM